MSVGRIIDFSLIGLMVVVFGLRIAGAAELAIALGALLPWIIGMVVILIAAVAVFLNRGSSDGKKDFSSFSAQEERAFVGHEQKMRFNSKRAAIVGFAVGGVGFLLATGIVAACYSPCTKFCERPPSSCKTDKDVANFKAVCEKSCAGLESSKGQSYVTLITGCAFSNSTSGGCEEPVKAATALGLWCEDKN